MALYDLTPEQISSVAQAIYAPPPPSLAAPQSESPTAMFSSSQRFIDQLGKMQKARDEAQRQNEAASAINQINPLDPDFDNKVKDVAMRFGPDAFASSSVQHVLSLSDRQRSAATKMQENEQKAAQKNMLDVSFRFLKSADENQLGQFVEQFPDAARELAPVMDKRFEDLTAARTQLSQLPEHLHGDLLDANKVPVPAKVSAKLKEFNDSFEGPLGKVANLQTKQKLADLARQWKALPEADTEQRDALVGDITSLLDAPDPVSDSTIKNILSEASRLAAPVNPYIEAMRKSIEEDAAKKKAAAEE